MAAGSKIEQVKTTVRRAVDEAQHLRGRIEEAVEDLRTRLSEAALANLADDELEALLEEMREEAREEARAEMRREAEAEPVAPVGGRSAAELLAAAAALDRARGQKEVLDTLVAESERFAPRALLLLVRPDRLAGWGARGLAIDRDRVRSLSLDRGDELWAAMVDGDSAGGRRLGSDDSAALVDRLAPGGIGGMDDSGAGRPAEGALVPMVLRDRVSALLYVDRTDDDADGALDLEALQLLTHFAALSLETLTLRQRESTVTLAPVPALEEPAAATDEPEPDSEELEDPVGSALGQPDDEDDLALEPAPEAEESTTPPHGDELPTGAPVSPSTPVYLDEEDEEDEVVELDVEDEPETPEPAEGSAPSWAAPATDWQAPATATADDALPEVEEVELDDEPATPQAETVGGYSDFEMDEDLDAPELEAPELEEPPVAGETIAWSTDQAGGPEVVEAVEEVDVEDLDDDESLEEIDEIEDAEEVDVAAEPHTPAGAETTLLPTMPETTGPETEALDTSGTASEAPEPVAAEESPQATTSTPIAPRQDEEPDDGAGAAAGGGQVTPPADVEGPGWAFNNTATSVPSGDQAAHDEARRLARLLVSEIQLYNQEEVEEGRRNNDVYERLREDIDRSRQLYEERVDPSVRESTDYFYQELVRQLAAGDAKALGI